MKTHIRPQSWVLAAFLGLAACANPGAPAAQILMEPDSDGWIVAVGDRIPSLELTDPAGQVRSLDEFLGQPLVLLFWGTT